jgi:glutathione synthase/RimK-type ligase-like ATP-grasp enzyme
MYFFRSSKEEAAIVSSVVPLSVALVSCAEARDYDTDLPLLVRAFGDRGIVTDIVDWDNADIAWSSYRAAIVRSPWDYHRRYSEFLEWLDNASTQTTVFNSADIIKWNTDKVYLQEMIDADIPVIPTTYVHGAEDLVLANDLIKGDVVVKPTISAGSNNTERHVNVPASAAAHITQLVDRGMVAMVQPYQRFIDERGETGMLYFNGEYSHAFRKGAILATGDNAKNGLYTEEDIGPRDASREERELGDDVIDFVTEKYGTAPLYARVDVVRGSGGYPVLMELEMAEPSLYLHTSRDSATRFVSAFLSQSVPS